MSTGARVKLYIRVRQIKEKYKINQGYKGPLDFVLGICSFNGNDLVCNVESSCSVSRTTNVINF